MKILLIDHHVLFREGLRVILQQLPGGVDEILEADNFQEGLYLAGQHSDLSLVLLELNTLGNRAAISVKSFTRRYPGIPLVVVSAEENCQVMKEAMNNGARGFVSKSSAGSVLLGALNLVLAGSIYVPPRLMQPPLAEAEISRNGDRRCSKAQESGLTRRQAVILRYLADGLSNKEIAKALDIAEGTAKIHVASIYRALQVNSRLGAKQVAEKFALAGSDRQGA